MREKIDLLTVFRKDKGEWAPENPTTENVDTISFDLRARIALCLIERWGMVAGIEDGEDKAGRRQFRLQTPEELITRAFTTAGLAVKEMLDRAWAVRTDHLINEVEEEGE